MIKIRKEVESTARRFVINNIGSLPVDLESLCNGFGWVLRASNLEGADGYVIISNKSKIKYIYYDDSPNYILSNRYRFTIAHEIGHIILGHYKLNQELLSDNDIADMDDEADAVAAEILMPYSELKKFKDYDIDELSHYFQVSRMAMSNRLKKFNLLEKKNPCRASGLTNEIAY